MLDFVSDGFGCLMAPDGFGGRLRNEFEGYSSSTSRSGNVQPAYLEAFDFNSHLPEQNRAQRSEQIPSAFEERP